MKSHITTRKSTKKSKKKIKKHVNDTIEIKNTKINDVNFEFFKLSIVKLNIWMCANQKMIASVNKKFVYIYLKFWTIWILMILRKKIHQFVKQKLWNFVFLNKIMKHEMFKYIFRIENFDVHVHFKIMQINITFEISSQNKIQSFLQRINNFEIK